MSKIQVGIAGLGRSGWDIHANQLAKLPELFEIAGAMDLDATRRQDATQKFGARTYDNFSSLVADPDLELIVVATPNFLHKSNVIEALEAGKHVVCEKPFGTSLAEVDAMIAASNRTGKHVVPFHNRRFEEHFQKVKEVIESGILGEIQLIRIASHGFGRRWDWQTLREFGGGAILNNGPHWIDQAVQLLSGDEVPQVWADLRNVLSSGDAEDHIKIVLKSHNGPTIDLELTSCGAFPQDHWLVLGKNGGLRGTTKELEWKWVDWTTMPERLVERTAPQGRAYYGEKLEWQTDSAQFSEDFNKLSEKFYTLLASALREGAPLPVTPQSVRKQMAVIEQAKALTGF